MYISQLQLVNFRNFERSTLTFSKGVNTIIGENGSGKTNVFRAIRLLLDDNMVRAAYRLNEDDFHRSGQDWKGHWIIISIEFQEVSADEAIQALFVHGTGNIQGEKIKKATYNLIFRPKNHIRALLSAVENGDKKILSEIRNKITISDYETVFTGRSEADFTSRKFYKEAVGDFDKVIMPPNAEHPEIGTRLPSVLSISKEIAFTFIQVLRDVIAEFHNNRTNPLLALLKSRSENMDEDVFTPIVSRIRELNDSIEVLPDVQEIRKDILATIRASAGEAYSPAAISIKSELSEDADKLFQSLKLFISESEDEHEGPIHDLSLGGANLIFLTLKLLEFKYIKDAKPAANFLLIEEPEAHIHTHIQKTLFDRLKFEGTQIIYSTHSTHISEVSNVRNINILGRTSRGSEAFYPANDLSGSEVTHIQRYLDAIRSNLLFAKSVILVEGDAEEILIPVLLKKFLGLSVDELGISVINIRSTGFKNVAILFAASRIRKKCAILTDLDTAIVSETIEKDDTVAYRKFRRKCAKSEKAGRERKILLDGYCEGNTWVETFYAPTTFEIEFLLAGNAHETKQIVDSVYIKKY